MAAPTVRGRTAPVAGLSATSPAGTAIGDAVIVWSWEQRGAGVPTHTLQTGFVELFSQGHDDGSTDGRLSVAYKIATSGGATSYQAYTSSDGTTVRTGIIVLTVGTHSLGTTQKGAATGAGVTNTATSVPNPASVTLGTARDWLVVAFAGWHMSASATVTPTAPTNYSNLQHVAGASTSETASAERSLTAPASEDPGTFGDDVTPSGSSSVTVGIPNPVERSAAVAATGAVVAAATFFSIVTGAAAVGATAAIASSGESESPAAPSHERSAAIGATGAVAAAGTFFSVFERSAAIGATGTIATGRLVVSLRSASLNATAGIASSATFLSILERSSAVAGVATVSSSGTFLSILSRSAAIAGTAGIATGRLVAAHRSASLSGLAGLAVAGEIAGAVTRSVALNAVGSISATAAPAHTRAAVLTAVASISAAGATTATLERSASLEAVGLVAVAGVIGAIEVVEFPVSRAPVIASPTAGRLVAVDSPGLEVASSSVPVIPPAGGGRILSPDDPRLEVA